MWGLRIVPGLVDEISDMRRHPYFGALGHNSAKVLLVLHFDGIVACIACALGKDQSELGHAHVDLDFIAVEAFDGAIRRIDDQERLDAR